MTEAGFLKSAGLTAAMRLPCTSSMTIVKEDWGNPVRAQAWAISGGMD